MNSHIEQYRRSQVFGMTQKELVVMLYRGAIRFLNEAKTALAAERYDQSWQKFDRARKIVLHLYSTLNMEAGQIAHDLATLYSHLIEQISVANAERNAALADHCIKVLSTVKEGWEQIPDSEKPADQPVVVGAANSERHLSGVSVKA